MEGISAAFDKIIEAKTLSCEIEELENLASLTSEFERVDVEEHCENEDDPTGDACLAKLIGYLFPRRYGWKDNGYKLPMLTLEQQQAGKINAIIDEIIEWLLEQPLSSNLLSAYYDCIKKASNSPVVRNQTSVHVMQWLKECQHSDMLAFQAHFNEIVNVLLLVVSDIWSAIRKTCVYRLGPLLNNFSLNNVETLFTEVIKICVDEASWQAVEGAVMAISTIVRKFHWKSTIEGLTSNMQDDSDQHFFLMFGGEELEAMPLFISQTLPDTVFSLLAHPQQTVREHAIKAYSAYISKCEFKYALAAFEQVIERLCRGLDFSATTTSSSSSSSKQKGSAAAPDIQAAISSSSYVFMDPYEAEGLLGVATNLVKHISPHHLLPGWNVYMATFSLYLMHPASTVRQTTSNIFKFIIAKDSSNPLVLQRVLSSLCREWQPDMTALTHTHPDNTQASTERAPSITQFVANKQDLSVSRTWQWREGRLLAYELILQFLIKNHWLYTFGAANLQANTQSTTDNTNDAISNTTTPEDDTFDNGFSNSDRSNQRSSFKVNSCSNGTTGHRRRTTSLSLHPSPHSKPIQIVEPGRRDSAGAGASSSAGAADLSLAGRHMAGWNNAQRGCTVDPGASLKTLGRHFSYYTQGQQGGRAPGEEHGLSPRGGLPNLRTTTVNNSSTSLLLACYARDRKISTTTQSNKRAGGNVAAACGEISDALGEQSLSVLLELMLYQTVESLADPQWETRRMAQQLLPCISEVLRWYNISVLVRLWKEQLSRGSTLLTYGTCLALKYSLVHAARLQHLLNHPPTQWQDAGLCRAVIERITLPIQRGVCEWSAATHSLLQRPRYDRLTAAAMETLLLTHCHYTLSTDMRCGQLHRVVSVLREVFSKAHPSVVVDPQPRQLPKAFLVPQHGVFSCVLRGGADSGGCSSFQVLAQQVEKCLLTEIQHSLASFLRLSDSKETAYLLPILSVWLSTYATDDTLLRHISDCMTSLIGVVKKKKKNTVGDGLADNLVQQCCVLSLARLADLLANKAMNLVLVKSACDMYLQLCEHIPSALHLPTLCSAINMRLQATVVVSVRPLQRICSAPDNTMPAESTLVPPPLLNGAQNGHRDEDEDTSDEDPHLEPASEHHLAESQTLNHSINSTSTAGTGHASRPARSDGDDDDDDWDSGSDWDSDGGEEEEERESHAQPAITAAFKEFFSKLQAQCQKQQAQGSTFKLSSEVKRLKLKNVQKTVALLDTLL